MYEWRVKVTPADTVTLTVMDTDDFLQC